MNMNHSLLNVCYNIDFRVTLECITQVQCGNLDDHIQRLFSHKF